MIPRAPAVAGRFYPSDRKALRSTIEDSFYHGPGTLPGAVTGRREIVAGVVSNAGLVHCGPTSAYFFKALKEDGTPETFVVIGDNHYSGSDHWHLHPSGHWQTPMGVAAIDEELTEAISSETDIVEVNAQSYERQHSVEVHLPFLQYLFDEVRFVPIMTPAGEPWKGTEVGLTIARAAKKVGRDVVIISSSSASMYFALSEAFG